MPSWNCQTMGRQLSYCYYCGSIDIMSDGVILFRDSMSCRLIDLR